MKIKISEIWYLHFHSVTSRGQLNFNIYCFGVYVHVFSSFCKITSSHVVDSFRNKINCLTIKQISLTSSKVRLLVRMFSSKFFIKAFRNFPTKLNDDGLYFSRHYNILYVVILCLTLTVCLGQDVKSVPRCVGNFMFIETMNICIGEYTCLNSKYEFIFSMF